MNISIGRSAMNFCVTPKYFLSVLSIALSCCPQTRGFVAEAEVDSLPAKVDFNDHIRPIFNQHCVACHGGVKQAADISFVYKEQVLPPEGWIVEPGVPDESILIERVLESDLELRMPPPEHGNALSPRDVALLKKWIEQGAVWDASHWAYSAPSRQVIPEVSDPDWVRVPMDNFVLARLDAEGLEPSVDVSPERWLRRVSLDLTGLPPTLVERDSFLEAFAKDPDSARKQTVDRLLDSPAFGERWASVWLDQIRYADSKGLGADGRRSVWKYRDWVIDAINRDMPFDEFTVKQLAGDLLPDASISDLVATTAHRVTQTNEEGGTDDEEFRVAAVLDRVNTTWQVWQGVTFGCVQCHGHPYDPFRHEEYYQFAAFFNNTADCDLNEDWPTVNVPIDTADYAKATELDREVESVRQEIWEQEFQLLNDASVWQPIQEMEASTNKATRVEVETVDDHAEFHTVDTVSSNTDITLEATLPDDLSKLSAIRLTALPLNPEIAARDSEWGFVLSGLDVKLIVAGEESARSIEIERLVIDEANPFFDPQDSLNPKSNRGFAAYTRINGPRQAALVLKSSVDVPEDARLQITLKHRVYILAAFSLITRRGHLAVSDDPQFTELLSDENLVAQRQQLSKLMAERREIESVSTPVMQKLPERFARPQHVFERGLFLTKADEVSPGTPASLPPLLSGAIKSSVPAATSTSDTGTSDTGTSDTGTSDAGTSGVSSPNRLDMALWLVSDNNPLTARVTVNRFWARLFGVGIVATEEDFGSSGDLPSHPQLLDFLALRFQQEHRWSIKALLRELVLSRTYGQSSKVTADLYQRDPNNRLLARGPRYRLSSEIVRDQALALSGLLSEKQFGPPVFPPIPDGVWKPFQGGDKWNIAKVGDEDRYRRSIYTYTKRSIPYPMFAAFDAPSREFCTPRRLRSNTPLQALMMLNDVTFIECSIALADRMREFSEIPAEQIRHGFLIVTCREPSDREMQDLMALLNLSASDEGSEGLNSVAAVLLNLDEVVMK